MRLVEAQQARRVVDRLVGYKLSPLLWRKVRRGLSAGRVQSVAVRLVVEREREIAAFIPEEYWIIMVKLHNFQFSIFNVQLVEKNEEKLKIEKKLDQLGVPVGVFTTVKIEGENAIGVARDVAVLLARHRADTRNGVERVFENNRFLIRILLKVDYRSKKKIEEELKKKYQECVVV